MRHFIWFLLITVNFNTMAQVGIGTTEPKAALDIYDTEEGILIPRITLTNTTTATIHTPTESELIYNTATVNDVTPGFYYWDGSQWVSLKATENLENYTYPTLLNGYSNFGGSHSLTKYYKKNGRVYLNGVVNGAASYTNPMFMLPVGYRPSKRLILPAYTAGSTNGRVDILPTGEVIFYIGGNLVSLDGLSFRVN